MCVVFPRHYWTLLTCKHKLFFCCAYLFFTRRARSCFSLIQHSTIANDWHLTACVNRIQTWVSLSVFLRLTDYFSSNTLMHCDFVFAHPYAIENIRVHITVYERHICSVARTFVLYTLCVVYPCLYILTHCSPLCTVGLQLISMLLDVGLI